VGQTRPVKLRYTLPALADLSAILDYIAAHSPQAVTIRSLPRAFELVKGMQAQGLEWGEGYRALGRQAIGDVLRGQMDQAIDEHLDRMAVLDEADRRNGSYPRHLLSELGDIELLVPRTRRFAPIGVVRAYARRPEQSRPRRRPGSIG
jgi:hypothetical protein